jgi:hypothetical protein
MVKLSASAAALPAKRTMAGASFRVRVVICESVGASVNCD